MDFITDLPPMLQVFWYIALPVSLIFLIQSVMTILGLSGSDAEADTGFDGDFQVFSFRNLINFLLGFSWAGIGFYNSFENKNLVLGIAIIIGMAFVVAFFYLLTIFQKLAEDNSFNIKDAIDKSGSVYLSIPGNLSGKGKVMISVKGTTHELDAVTNEERIETGSIIVVTDVTEQNILIVEKIKN